MHELGRQTLSPRNRTIVKRDVVLRAIAKAKHARLVLVTASGGWGKSTLLADHVWQCGCQHAWHDLRELDQDPAEFMAAIGKALSHALPGSNTAPPPGTTLQAQARAMLSAVFDIFPACFLLVLDDYHLADRGPGLPKAMQALIDHAPTNLHLIVSSRASPRLSLAKLRAQKAVLEIGQNELRFSSADVQEYFRLRLGREFNAREVGAIVHKTEGWPLGLHLAADALKHRGGANVEKLPGLLSAQEGLLHDYFLEELLAHQPPELQRFLLETALFESFTLELCRDLLDMANPAALLAEAEARNLFLIPLDQSCQAYRYHHLFQDFLTARATRGLGPERLRAIHAKAAERCAAAQDWLGGLRHAVAMEDWDIAAGIVQQAQAGFMTIGKEEILLQLLERIPEAFAHDNPALVLAKSSALHLTGCANEALTMLYEGLRRFDGAPPTVLGQMTLQCMSINFAMDRHAENDSLARAALARVPQESPFALLIMSMHAISLMQLNNSIESAKVWQRIENHPALTQHLDIYANVAPLKGLNYHCFMGEFEDALRVLDQAVHYYSRKNFLGRYGKAMAYLGFTKHEMGYFEDAASILDKSLHELYSQSHVDAEVLISALSALNALRLDSVRKAEDVLRRAEQCMRTVNSSFIWKNLFFHAARACLAHRRQRTDDFFRDAEATIAIAERKEIWFDIYFTYSVLAPCFAALGQLDKARHLLERSLEAVRQVGAAYAEARTRLLLASVLLDQGLQAEARRQLTAAVAIADQRGYDFLFLRKEPEAASRLLALSLESAEHFEFTASVLVRLRGSGEPLLPLLRHDDRRLRLLAVKSLAAHECRSAEKDLLPLARSRDEETRTAAQAAVERLRALAPLPLQVRLLGGFHLSQGARQVPASAWRRKTARSIFKFLAYQAGKEFDAGRLADIFFPDLDANAARSLLHQAASVIRVVLEPGIPAKRESSYLKAHDGAYRLILPPDSCVDAVEFERLCREAETSERRGDEAAAIELYGRAVELYPGDFLADEPYAEWPAGIRARLVECLSKALLALARKHHERREHELCVAMLERLLERTPWDEQAAELLMRSHLALGDRARAAKAFLDCARSLREDLGIQPSKELATLYAQMTREPSAQSSK